MLDRKFLLFSLVLACMLGSMFCPAEAGTMNSVDLAKRQKIKTEIMDALVDGKIAPQERAIILMHAQEFCTPEEMDGLKQTLNRLASDEKNASPSTVPNLATRKASSSQSLPFAGSIKQLPYVDDYGTKRKAVVSQTKSSLPYFNPPRFNGEKIGDSMVNGMKDGVKTSTDRLAKIRNEYIEQPTLSKAIARNADSANGGVRVAQRTTPSPSIPIRNDVAGQKTAAPRMQEPLPEPPVVKPYADESVPSLVTPAGALLPDVSSSNVLGNVQTK